MQRIIFVVLTLLVFTGCSFIDSSGGTQGKIIDKETHQILSDVVVVIKNTQIRTKTDSTGYYRLPGLCLAHYQILYYYSHYDTVIVDAVDMKPDQLYTIDVALSQVK